MKLVESHAEDAVVVIDDGVVRLCERLLALLWRHLAEHFLSVSFTSRTLTHVVEPVQPRLDLQAVGSDLRRILAVKLTQEEHFKQSVELALRM